MAYRARRQALDYGPGNVGAPQVDASTLVEALTGGASRLIQLAYLREQARADRARQAEMDRERREERDYQRSRDVVQDAREAARDRREQEKQEAELSARGYVPPSTSVRPMGGLVPGTMIPQMMTERRPGYFDPERSVEFRAEEARRRRIMETYRGVGLNPAQAAAAVENPGLADNYLFPRQSGQDGESGTGRADTRRQQTLTTLNAQIDDTRQQLGQTPLPSRPVDEFGDPLGPEDTTPEQERAFQSDSTRVAALRDRLRARGDSLNAVRDSVAAEQQGRRLAPRLSAAQRAELDRRLAAIYQRVEEARRRGFDPAAIDAAMKEDIAAAYRDLGVTP